MTIQNYALILRQGDTFHPVGEHWALKNSLPHPLDVTIVNSAIDIKMPREQLNSVVTLHNQTRHQLHAQANAVFSDAGVAEVRVLIQTPPGYVDPLLQELKDTQAVLGDAVQEKLAGAKVYVVSWTRAQELLPYVFTSLQAAEKMVEGREGKFITWTEHNSHGRCWMSDRYTITELEIA